MSDYDFFADQILEKVQEDKVKAEMIALKPCPFCGGEGKYHRGVCKVEGGFSDFVVVFCKECGVRTKKIFYDKRKHGVDGEYDEAKEAWNRRLNDGKGN